MDLIKFILLIATVYMLFLYFQNDPIPNAGSLYYEGFESVLTAKNPNEQNEAARDNNKLVDSILKNTTVQEKIEPQVKHSYIFNKYFKNYKEPNAIEQPRRPMTRQEYQKMLLDDLIKRKLAKKRIAQIKSKKLSFTNNNNAAIYASQNNLNHLFRF
jgi:hypothetical protein